MENHTVSSLGGREEGREEDNACSPMLGRDGRDAIQSHTRSGSPTLGREGGYIGLGHRAVDFPQVPARSCHQCMFHHILLFPDPPLFVPEITFNVTLHLQYFLLCYPSFLKIHYL